MSKAIPMPARHQRKAQVRVVTDSTADIPPQLAEELGITVIPCNVQFGLESYRDGVDLTREEFYAKLVESPELPTTSVPSVGVFTETYRELAKETNEIVSIHLSSSLSALYSTACLGAKDVAEVKIKLVDSRQASMGLGWLAIAAAEAAKEGRGSEEIVAIVKDMIPRTRVLAALDTLEYLRRGGRVSTLVAALGTVLSIKPILEIKEGEVLPKDRVRTREKSIRRLVEIVRDSAPFERLAVIHANVPEVAKRLVEMLSPYHPAEKILIAEVGTVLATHAGPGAIGAAFVIQR
jgi:DegV family protein with EDD domain